MKKLQWGSEMWFSFLHFWFWRGVLFGLWYSIAYKPQLRSGPYLLGAVQTYCGKQTWPRTPSKQNRCNRQRVGKETEAQTGEVTCPKWPSSSVVEPGTESRSPESHVVIYPLDNTALQAGSGRILSTFNGRVTFHTRHSNTSLWALCHSSLKLELCIQGEQTQHIWRWTGPPGWECVCRLQARKILQPSYKPLQTVLLYSKSNLLSICLLFESQWQALAVQRLPGLWSWYLPLHISSVHHHWNCNAACKISHRAVLLPVESFLLPSPEFSSTITMGFLWQKSV